MWSGVYWSMNNSDRIRGLTTEEVSERITQGKVNLIEDKNTKSN